MAKHENTTRPLSEILKEKVEVDFRCPKCEATKLYEMRGSGHRVHVFTNGEYSIDESDSLEPEWLYYCCGECGLIILQDTPWSRGGVVKDSIELLEWLFDDFLESVTQSALESDQFPIPK